MRRDDVLSVLRHADRPMTVTEILAELLLESTPSARSTCVSHLHRMRSLGMVRRVSAGPGPHTWEVKR